MASQEVQKVRNRARCACSVKAVEHSYKEIAMSNEHPDMHGNWADGPDDPELDIFEGGSNLPYWMFRSMAAWVEDEQCERGTEYSCGESVDCITEYCVPCAAKIWMDETRRREAIKHADK